MAPGSGGASMSTHSPPAPVADTTHALVPAILFTPDRLRLMTKTNRNNRLSTEAIESTGFRFARTDFAAAVAETIEWYRSKGWLLRS